MAGFGTDHGTVATYRWGGTGWKHVATKKVKKLNRAQLAPYFAWSGSGVKVWTS